MYVSRWHITQNIFLSTVYYITQVLLVGVHLLAHGNQTRPARR